MNIIQLLASDGFITVNKRLIKELGLAEAVIFGLMCSEHTRWAIQDKLYESSKFYLIIEKVEEVTGLSYYKQQKAIKNLEDVGFIKITLEGVPAKRYFEIDEMQVLNFFETSFQATQKQDVEKFDINNNITNNNINNNSNELLQNSAKHKNDVLDSLKKDIMDVHSKTTSSNRTKAKANNFLGSVKREEEKSKKLNKFQQCVKVIDEYEYSKDPEVRDLLIQYLNLTLEQAKNGDRVFYVNQWRGMLNKLNTLTKQGNNTKVMIQQSLDRGYRDFFAVNSRLRSTFTGKEDEYINEVNKVNTSTDVSQQVHLRKY